jgi:solute carrier family 39 (zinc transporter), member 7
LTFFIVEKLMRIIRGDGGHGHSHSHSHHRTKPQQKSKSSDNETDDERSESDAPRVRSRRGSRTAQREGSRGDDHHHEDHLNEHHEVAKSGVAWLLNLVADMMHNFTDGLAIGASFIAGNTVGVGE